MKSVEEQLALIKRGAEELLVESEPRNHQRPGQGLQGGDVRQPHRQPRTVRGGQGP
ncbi:hypothetical protein ACQKP7_22835, partial [Pseudomonas frederiksbergensis]|uniref:hypothetical protein n=1 Tax=Pseudomonas frederiksbergensis TaxID=104087 RepID=UPI003D0118E8